MGRMWSRCRRIYTHLMLLQLQPQHWISQNPWKDQKHCRSCWRNQRVKSQESSGRRRWRHHSSQDMSNPAETSVVHGLKSVSLAKPMSLIPISMNLKSNSSNAKVNMMIFQVMIRWMNKSKIVNLIRQILNHYPISGKSLLRPASTSCNVKDDILQQWILLEIEIHELLYRRNLQTWLTLNRVAGVEHIFKVLHQPYLEA